jgi:branched-chain amino acid transport system substrate-binding protein
MKDLFLRRNFLSIFLIAILFVGIVSCEKKQDNTAGGGGGAQADTIKIGEYGSLTGDTATFGISTREGIDLALDEVNKAGGLLGKKVEVVVEDDRGKQEEAKTVVQKLIDKDKVIAVLGEVASTRSIAGGQVCQSKGIPMISPSSTNPQVTQIGDYIFRVCFLDDFQGEVMARFATNTLKAKRVAIFYDKSNDYSVGLSKFFREAFEKSGGQIVAEEAYQTTDSDFSAQLTNISAQKPDAIYVPGYYTQVGQIAQQARKAGVTVPLLGGDGWDSPTLVEIGKEAINGCYFSNHYTIEDPDPAVQKFVNDYKAKFNKVPDALAALAYDAARILFESIKKAGSTDSKAIRDAIAQTKDFKGVTGNITISPTRDAIKSAVIVAVENGKYKFKESMAPATETQARTETK